MVLIRDGHVEGGRVVIPDQVSLPEGTAVRVAIEVIDESQAKSESDDQADTNGLPGFGMWADRDDMQDSVEWVNRQRDAWRDRISHAQ